MTETRYEDLKEDDDDAEEQQVGLSDAFIAEIVGLLNEDYIDRIQELCRELPATDAAELLTKVGPERRRHLVEILEDFIDPETFSYIDTDILNDLLGHMSGPYIASIVNELDSDDAINLINDLDEDRQHEILRLLSRKVRAAVEEGLTFDEDSAGRLMQREFVAIPQFWTIGKTVDYLRAAAEALPERFYDVFIVDPMHKFVGSVALSRVLCSQRAIKIDTLVSEEHLTIPVDMDREHVAHLFRRKDLLSAPVVNEDDKLIGMITVDDIVDVIDAEAEEDILKLGGLSDSDIYRSTLATVRSRAAWLAVNLCTAFLAASVIGLFRDSIEKIVALAVLMPIVASMGGNAGTQAMTVAVRGLATKELSRANSWRIVGKECVVGLLNGAALSVLLGSAVYFWFRDPVLAIVISAALMINLFFAGLFGAMIPITLDRMGLDPAPSAGIFLTTFTDVIGFVSFLGLATWLLI